MNLGWIFSLSGLIVFLRRMKPWKKPPMLFQEPEADPTISIIVPCRNEEKRVEALLQSLLNISYSGFEVIIADDQSTDRTVEICQKYPVKIISVPDKPLTWSGKNWACWHGAQAATGEIFVFSDADTRHAPSSLQEIVSYLQKQNVDFFSAPPFHLAQRIYEKVLGLFHLFPLIATAYQEPPQPHRLYAIGQYMVIKKAVYFQLGGHSAIASSLVDDIDLAQRALKQGFHYRVYPYSTLYSVQMFDDFPSFYQGWIRLFRLGMQRSSLRSFFEIFLIVHLFIAWIWNPTAEQVLFCILGLMALAWVQNQHLKTNPWSAVFAPMSVLVFTVLSAIAFSESLLKRKINWRGRKYISS